MKPKSLLLIIGILIATMMILSSCGSKSTDKTAEAPMEMMNTMAMDSIETDFMLPLDSYQLESDEMRYKIEEYLLTLNNKLNIEKGHYAFGDMDGDMISEIVLFIQRQPDDVNDPGYLQVYKFIGGNYVLIDSISMNYDNTNYSMEIGKISDDSYGVYLSNQVGSQAGITYGYKLQDGKLKSILNPKKINLFSVSTNNGIEDIDGDGILEFSIYTIDPETSEKNTKDADKILLWYKWDGLDGGFVVQRDWVMQFGSINAESSRVGMMAIENPKPKPGELDYIKDLESNMSQMTKQDVVDSLDKHLKAMQGEATYKSLDVSTLFNRYFKDFTFDVVFERYGLSQDRLNDIEYLNRERVLASEPDLKNILIKNLNQGYKLIIDNGRYFYQIDYDRFLGKFNDNITNEYRSYLRIMGREVSNPHKKNNFAAIPKSRLADRLTEIERFRLTYSYSNKLGSLLTLYEHYLDTLLYIGESKNTFDAGGSFIKESKDELILIAETYKDSYFADVISRLINLVDLTTNKVITEDIRREISYMIP